jgi:hypothetical protein
MRVNFNRYIALFIVASSIVGCAMAKPPLQRDENYPSTWKDIGTLGTECKLLAGTYSNKGITADFDENTYSIMLTDILPVRIVEGAKNIHLNIVTRKIDIHQDTFATLQVTADGSQEDIIEFNACYCVKQALFYKAEEKSGEFPTSLFGVPKRTFVDTRYRRSFDCKKFGITALA